MENEQLNEKFLYRYELLRCGSFDIFGEPVGTTFIQILPMKYSILKQTKCGYWIEYWGAKLFGDKKFVNLEKTKKFANVSKELALKDFLARKKRYIEILRHRLAETEEIVKSIESDLKKDPSKLDFTIYPGFSIFKQK